MHFTHLSSHASVRYAVHRTYPLDSSGSLDGVTSTLFSFLFFSLFSFPFSFLFLFMLLPPRIILQWTFLPLGLDAAVLSGWSFSKSDCNAPLDSDRREQSAPCHASRVIHTKRRYQINPQMASPISLLGYTQSMQVQLQMCLVQER